MKLLVLAFLAFTAVSAVDRSGPEWDPIDWSRVYDPVDFPGFWDNTAFVGMFPKPNAKTSRIVGGQEAKPNQFPYQVSLLHVRTILASICGGSIINPTNVLTAAHCPIGTTTTTVIAGAHDRTRDEPTQQRVSVPSANYRIHAGYNNQNLNNDIAILRLGTSLIINAFVAPIALAPKNAESFVGQIAKSSGWGRVADGQPAASVLRWVTNPIISNDQCAGVFGQTVVNDAVICTDTTGGRGTCQGDSGGPLAIPEDEPNLLIGVTSFGASAGCEAGLPAGYERVSAQRTWIDETVAEL